MRENLNRSESGQEHLEKVIRALRKGIRALKSHESDVFVVLPAQVKDSYDLIRFSKRLALQHWDIQIPLYKVLIKLPADNWSKLKKGPVFLSDIAGGKRCLRLVNNELKTRLVATSKGAREVKIPY